MQSKTLDACRIHIGKQSDFDELVRLVVEAVFESENKRFDNIGSKYWTSFCTEGTAFILHRTTI